MPWGRVGGQSEKTRVAASQHPSTGPPRPHSPCRGGSYRRPCLGRCRCPRTPPSGAALSSGSRRGSRTPGIYRAHSTRPWRHPHRGQVGTIQPGSPFPQGARSPSRVPGEAPPVPPPHSCGIATGGRAGALGAGPREGTWAAAGRRAGAGLTLASAARVPRSPRTERSTRRGSGLPRSWTTASRGGTAWALSPSCGWAEVSPVPGEQVGGSPETTWAPPGQTGQATCSLQ